jgi:hypothetical protein
MKADVFIRSRAAHDSTLSTLGREESDLGGAEIVTSPQPMQGGRVGQMSTATAWIPLARALTKFRRF